MRKSIDLERAIADDFETSVPAELLYPRNNPAIVAALESDRTRLFWELIVNQFGDLEPDRPDDDGRALSSLELPVEPLEDLELEDLAAHCDRVGQAFGLLGLENMAAVFGEIAAALRDELATRRRVAQLPGAKGKAKRKRANGARAPKVTEACT